MEAREKENRIGFEVREDKLELVLPIFIKDKKLNTEDELKQKIKYFNLLRKYKKNTSSIKKENLQTTWQTSQESYMYSIFEAYYLLLIDYIELGPFLFTERNTGQKNKGRLNWTRTINRSRLLISDDNFLYVDPFYTYRKIDYNHPLTIIYGFHLLEIEKVIGINLSIHGEYRNLIEKNIKNINIKTSLNNFRTKMYSDRERKIIKLLYIINDNKRKLDRSSTRSNLYYLENLNDLWEFILKNILKDQYYDFNEDLPKGRYNLLIEDKTSNKEEKTPYNRSGLSMIPDIIKEYRDKLYIIDAKNYLPHINGTMPGSSDINKQILYRYFLSKDFDRNNKYSLDNIENVFLLPNDLDGRLIEKIGKHAIENRESNVADIFIFQVDFNRLVDAYMEKDDLIEKEILNYIEESIK